MAITDPPSANSTPRNNRTDRKRPSTGNGSVSSNAPSAAVVIDILKASDHSRRSAEQQARLPPPPPVPTSVTTSSASPARSAAETSMMMIQMKPSEDTSAAEDHSRNNIDIVEQGRRATRTAAHGAHHHSTTADAPSISSMSNEESFSKKNSSNSNSNTPRGAASARRLLKAVVHVVNVPKKAVRKQGRRFFPGNGSQDKQDAIVANERTPLVARSSNNKGLEDDDADGQEEENTHFTYISPERKARIRAAWLMLAKKIKSGEMLLETALGGVYSDDDDAFYYDCSSSHEHGEHHLDSSSGMDRETIRQVKRRKAQQAIQSGLEFSVWQCLVAIILYMAVAIIAFSCFLNPDWTVIDSMYFAMVTFTTIGYGDLAPTSHFGRVFTIFYALSGVSCLGIALGVLGNRVIEAQNKAAEQTKEMAERRVMTIFSSEEDEENGNHQAVDAARPDTQKTQDDEEQGEESTVQHPILQLCKTFAFVVVILVVFACLVANDPGIGVASHFDVINAMYYAIITASTVGYGDFAPQSQTGRLVAMIYIPLAVGAMGHFLGIVASVIMDAKQDAFRREMQRKELTYHDLEVMDTDGNGIVTQAEFIEFMLVAMNKVDKDFMDELRTHFNRLDADGTGTLSKDDLIHNARQKLRTSAKKMELKAYKEKLLEQAETDKKRRQRLRDGGRQSKRKQQRASFLMSFKMFSQDDVDDDDDDASMDHIV